MDGTEDSTAVIPGDATNGLDVDVTRVSGTVTVAGAVTNAGTFAVQDSQVSRITRASRTAPARFSRSA
jgi:hypothetical protein